MRTKQLVMALALPALFAACQDQEYLSDPTNGLKGQFIKLEDGFALQGGYNDVSTRGQWDVVDGKAYFAWRPNQVGGSAGTKYNPDQIGLAWTGVCLDKDGNYVAEGSTLAKADGRVFTNYKFNHFAWKINGEDIVEDKCNPGTYTSGVEKVDGYTDGTSTLAAAYRTTDGEIEYTATAAAMDPTKWPTYTAKDAEVNGSEGLFNTNNSTMYAGQYIVYAPYDAHNTSNYIVATSKDEFTISKFESEANRAKTLDKFSNEIFKYGNTTIVDGGATTTKFATENLNGYIGIKLTSALSSATKIKKVIVFDETGKNLLTKVGLSSSGILENKSGKDVYLDNGKVAKEYTQTITATIGTPVALTQDVASYIAIPALPTEGIIPSLTVYLIGEDNKAVTKTFENITIERNKFANGTWLDFSDIDLSKGTYLATDQASLVAAVTAQNTADKDGIVKILGNIKLTTDCNIANIITKPIKVTIEGGKIILPDNNAAKVTLTLGSGVIVNSNIDVMRTCCSYLAGELVVKDATLGGIVNIGGVAADPEEITPANQVGTLVFSGNKTSVVNGTINNYGTAMLDAGANATDITQVDVNGTINNYATLKIGKAATPNKDAKLFILDKGALNNKSAATTTIEGVLAVAGKVSNDGVVVDKISSQVTGNIYELASPGEYISEVDNPGERFTAALTARPTTTVKFVGTTGQTYDLGKLTASNVRSTIKTYIVEEASGTTTFSAAATASASMKNLIVNSKLTLTNGSTLNLKITEKATINAEMVITKMDKDDKDKQCLDAKDLIVNAGGSLAIGQYVRSMMGTLTVNPAIKTPVKVAGKITFDFSSQTFVSGLINILGTADILQATGSASGEVAGDVWYKETQPQGAANWIHGIPTKFPTDGTWPTK